MTDCYRLVLWAQWNKALCTDWISGRRSPLVAPGDLAGLYWTLLDLPEVSRSLDTKLSQPASVGTTPARSRRYARQSMSTEGAVPTLKKADDYSETHIILIMPVELLLV